MKQTEKMFLLRSSKLRAARVDEKSGSDKEQILPLLPLLNLLSNIYVQAKKIHGRLFYSKHEISEHKTGRDPKRWSGKLPLSR